MRAAPELVDAIDDLAAARGWTRATFILHALGQALADDYGRFRRVPRSLAAIRLHRSFLDQAERAMMVPTFGNGQGRQRRSRPVATRTRIRNPERVYTERMAGRKVTSVRLTDEQRDAIDRQAAERNMTRSEWLEAAIDRGIEDGDACPPTQVAALRIESLRMTRLDPNGQPLDEVLQARSREVSSLVPSGMTTNGTSTVFAELWIRDVTHAGVLNEPDMLEGVDDLEPRQ